MGGGAFAHATARNEPTLNTPRLNPQEYMDLKQIYLKKLEDYFPDSKVFCLKEAPEKADYGDMDISIALDEPVDFVNMANFLGATGVICHSSGDVQKCTLGVPKDGTMSPRPVVVYKHVYATATTKISSTTTVTKEEYAQVDIDIIPSQLLDWHVFYSSYGDMAALLGHIVHHLGFTISDKGLWLRMKELDFSKTIAHANVADEDGKIELTYDPKLVMRFLGLSVERYEVGFETLDQLYEWLGKCSLLSAEAIKTKRDDARERNKQKRTVYSRFFAEWLPTHVDMEAEQDKVAGLAKLRKLRQVHLERAIDFFSKREQYTVKHSTLVVAINNAVATDLLRPLIAQQSGKKDKGLNEVIRAFRRNVGFGESNQPFVLGVPHSDAQSRLYRFLAEDGLSLQNPQFIDQWILENWEELRTLERRRLKVSTGNHV